MKKSIFSLVVALILTFFTASVFCQTEISNNVPNEQESVQQNPQVKKVADTIDEGKADAEKIETETEAVKENVENTKTDIENDVTSKESKTSKKADNVEKSSSGKIFNYSKDKSRTEIEIKVGRTVNAKPEINRDPVDVDDVYTVGIEVMAYSNSFLGFGAGIYNIFDSKLKKDGQPIVDQRTPSQGEYEIAFTNPYLTLKSKILQFDSDIIRNVYIYGQLGYGFMRIKNAYETEDGMYWGIGGGVEIWHFLLDVNYATNFGKIKMAPGENKIDVRQTTIIASIGYRFRL